MTSPLSKLIIDVEAAMARHAEIVATLEAHAKRAIAEARRARALAAEVNAATDNLRSLLERIHEKLADEGGDEPWRASLRDED